MLINPRLFSSRTTPIPVLLFTDPLDHERLRRILAPRFTSTAVKALEAGIVAQEAELGSATIAKSGIVRLLLCAANRDPQLFDHPETFDDDAKRRNHFSFGRGVHPCLGS